MDGQDYDDLYELAVNAGLREDRANGGLDKCVLEKKFNIRLSAQEWVAVINDAAEI